jgi:hypothetical protein
MSCQETNSAKHESLNKKLYDRNVPSKMLQPYLDVRPVMTKYSYFPIVDPRKEDKIKLNQLPRYNINNTFNPGTDTAPWSGYASNVNLESELRNQVYALQKCSQSVYVPNSSSNLYNHKIQPKKETNPHELLFQKQNFELFDPNPDSKVVGSTLFMNSTRHQLKESNKKFC